MLHLLLPLTALGAETVLTLEGEVPDDGLDHFFVPFDVPEGTVEIEVRHDDLSEKNVLDWGLDDPDGFRGWGGGNDEAAIVGIDAASRSYLPGSVAAGTWNVVVGKAKIAEEPALYHLEIVLRDAPTLDPQDERGPYEPVVLEEGARWYAGDFHVHSLESGDAVPTLDAVATFARSRGLDFVALSDHNTNSQVDFLADAQSRHPELLLMPSVEFTTYAGHANGIGATTWVDHRIGQPGATIEAAVEAFHDQGAVFSINHPALDLSRCIGCAWEHDLDPAAIDAVEVATGGWSQSGWLYTLDAIAFWDALCAEGHHIAPIGGSDDHRAGEDLGGFQSPIGDPTTLVFAEELSAEGILAGIRAGRTVVKLQGPDDPMVVLEGDVAWADDVLAGATRVRATVTGGDGNELAWVREGVEVERVAIEGDPFVHDLEVEPPDTGEIRVRAEVWLDDTPRTLTSHAWLAPAPPVEEEDPGPCGCATGGGAAGWALLAGLLARRRRT